jgi:hypothetical protein
MYRSKWTAALAGVGAGHFQRACPARINGSYSPRSHALCFDKQIPLPISLAVQPTRSNVGLGPFMMLPTLRRSEPCRR